MSEMAKKARAALRSKATKLASEPTGKVDASSFTPGAPMNADVKTGMRPVSKRAFKKGGKVKGEVAKKRADRVQRKAGGKVANEKAEARDIANAKVNRNLKDANQERAGIKHIGALKKGGRVKKKDGGSRGEEMQRVADSTPTPSEAPSTVKDKIRSFLQQIKPSEADRQAKSLEGVGSGQTSNLSEADKAAMDELVKNTTEGRKSGGRTKKMDGGMLQSIGAANAATAAPSTNLVPSSVLNIQPGGARGKFMKKGGKVSHMEWEHSKKDLEQDKKLAKKHGMSMEKWEKSAADEKHDKQQSTKGLCGGGRAKKMDGGQLDVGKPVTAVDTVKKHRVGKYAGGALSGYAEGGSTKKKKHKKDGKTHINIMIGGGKPAEDALPPGGMPPGMPPRAPAAMPPMPPGPPPGMPPMPPGPPPGMMPPGAGPGPRPPGPFRRGGRAKADGGHAYPEMKFGAGSGEGRLEKIEKYGKNAKK